MRRSWRVCSALFATAIALMVFPLLAQAETGFGACTEATDTVSLPGGESLLVGRTGSCAVPEAPSGEVFAAKLAADGSLVETYGDNGITKFAFGAVEDAEVTPDGRLLLASESKILRLTAGGLPDPGFGDAGEVSFPLPGSSLIAVTSIAVAADGGLIVAGSDSTSGALQGLTAGGAPDGSFAGGQTVRPTLDFPGTGVPASVSVDQVTVGHGGEVYAGISFGGVVDSMNKSGLGAFKLDATGDPDAAFGTDGVAVVDGSYDDLRDWGILEVSARPGGSVSILGNVVGTFMYDAPDAYVATLDAAGSTTQGVARFGLEAGTFSAADFAVASNGNPLIAVRPGTNRPPSKYAGSGKLAAARFLPNTSPDPAFGSDGLVEELVGIRSTTEGVAASASASVLVAGQAAVDRCLAGTRLRSCATVAVVSRFGESGSLDPSFGEGGVVTLPAFRCPGAVDPARGAHACRHGKLTEPSVRAAFRGRKFSRSTLTVRVKPATRRPDEARPWALTWLTLPRVLPLRPNALGSVRVFAGFGKRAARVPRGALTIEGRSLSVKRSAAQLQDAIRFEIPRRAIMRIPRRARGRKAQIRARFSWGAERRTGAGWVRIPR